jgi:hypothetical protein
VLSGIGLCDGLITRTEEFYRLWCVLVCDLGTSRMRRLKLIKGCECEIEEEEELPYHGDRRDNSNPTLDALHQYDRHR